MKILIPFLLLIISFHVNAQNRFYPSVKSLVENEKPSIFPPSLSFLEAWFKTSAAKMFHTDLQISNSPSGNASFFSLGVISRGMKRFEFFNSGFALTFNENVENPNAPINMRFTNKFPVFGYTTNFSLKEFDPNNNLKLFYLLQVVHNITDNQMLAFFLTLFVESKKNETRSQRLIKDINRVNQIKIDENLLENKDASLTDLCNAIKKEMPNQNCLYAVYRTYIETGNIEQTRANLRKFFNGVSIEIIDNTINNKIMPSGHVIILENSVSLSLPLTHFTYTSDSLKTNPVRFNVRELRYTTNYSFAKNAYIFSVEIYPHKDKNGNEIFQFERQTYNVFERKFEIKKVRTSIPEIQLIELIFTDKTLEVHVKTTEHLEQDYLDKYKTLNDITLNID